MSEDLVGCSLLQELQLYTYTYTQTLKHTYMYMNIKNTQRHKFLANR